MYSILIVEDDPSIIKALNEYLRDEGFETLNASGENKARGVIAADGPDLCLVDLALSDGSGFGVCSAAKQKGIPVIFLTASSDENSVVSGFDIGADDYIAKPFRPRELVSRIKNVIRRSSGTERIDLGCGLAADVEKGVITKNGTEIQLSALEYRILLLFLNNRGRLLSRGRILEDIWDIAGDYVNDNTLTVYIKRLREKIEDDPQQPAVIKTVRGLGYRMD